MANCNHSIRPPFFEGNNDQNAEEWMDLYERYADFVEWNDMKKFTGFQSLLQGKAAGGPDIPGVKHVINYDLPDGIDEYVHRIGRTGRVGNLGRSTSFYDVSNDSGIARALIKILADAQQDVPKFLESAADSAAGTYHGNAGGRFGSRDTRKFGGHGGGGFGGGSGGGGGDDMES